jgi:hypothetical protein
MLRQLVGVLVVLVMVFAVAAYAVAAETAASEAKENKAAEKAEAKEAKAAEKSEAAKPEPTAPPAADASRPGMPSTPEEMMTRMEERMKTANASEGLIMRYRQVQMAKLAVDEPIGLVALKDQIKLTAEQVKKIEDIAASARAQAKAVLTKEQLSEVEKMKDTPDTASGVSAQTRGMGRSGRGSGRD